MAVKIRMARIGKKNRPFFRIVAIDSRKKRDGAFLEDLGTYDPLATRLVRFEAERVTHWMALGAQMSDSVRKLQRLFLKDGIATVTASVEQSQESAQ